MLEHLKEVSHLDNALLHDVRAVLCLHGGFLFEDSDSNTATAAVEENFSWNDWVPCVTTFLYRYTACCTFKIYTEELVLLNEAERLILKAYVIGAYN